MNDADQFVKAPKSSSHTEVEQLAYLESFDPDSPSLKNAFKKAAGHDEPYCVWGFNLQPKGNDPRLVENRVLINQSGKPTAIEIHLITRKADGSARDKEVVSVEWPE